MPRVTLCFLWKVRKPEEWNWKYLDKISKTKIICWSEFLKIQTVQACWYTTIMKDQLGGVLQVTSYVQLTSASWMICHIWFVSYTRLKYKLILSGISKETRAGVCKTPMPPNFPSLNMAKFAQSIMPQNILDFAQKFNRLLIIPYQQTKFQTPSSDLTRLKCPLQRAITQNKLDRICSKVNQVICSSYPFNWPSFMPLAQIVFEISCWQV